MMHNWWRGGAAGAVLQRSQWDGWKVCLGGNPSFPPRMRWKITPAWSL